MPLPPKATSPPHIIPLPPKATSPPHIIPLSPKVIPLIKLDFRSTDSKILLNCSFKETIPLVRPLSPQATPLIKLDFSRTDSKILLNCSFKESIPLIRLFSPKTIPLIGPNSEAQKIRKQYLILLCNGVNPSCKASLTKCHSSFRSDFRSTEMGKYS